jgi:hypothetical protein
MKGRFVGRVAATGALCLGLSGCFAPGGGWELPSFMRPAPPAVPATHTYQPSAGEEINNTSPASEANPATAEIKIPAPAFRPPSENSGSRQTVSPAQPTPVATPAPPALPLSTPTVTLVNGPSKERAQHLLDDTMAKLAKVDRNSLGADSVNTYDQANNLLQAGRKAAIENDYVAASGFAEKAAVLAAKLEPASP